MWILHTNCPSCKSYHAYAVSKQCHSCTYHQINALIDILFLCDIIYIYPIILFCFVSFRKNIVFVSICIFLF